MKPLQGLTWLLILQLCGEILTRLLNLPFPGPVVGMVLLWPALSVPGIRDAEVNLVWDPPWGPHKMSDEARLELGML